MAMLSFVRMKFQAEAVSGSINLATQMLSIATNPILMPLVGATLGFWAGYQDLDKSKAAYFVPYWWGLAAISLGYACLEAFRSRSAESLMIVGTYLLLAVGFGHWRAQAAKRPFDKRSKLTENN